MIDPPGTVAPDATFVNETSALGAVAVTRVVDDAVLLDPSASAVAALAVAVLVTVDPFGVAAFTLTTSVKIALAPLASEGFVSVIVPVPPTAGVVAVQSLGCDSDTNVVPAGKVSLTDTLAASVGPAFVTTSA